MNVFGKLFGSAGKSGKGTTPQEAIHRLRETEEMLTKKQDFLEKKIYQELITAKKHGTKNKRGRPGLGLGGGWGSRVGRLSVGRIDRGSAGSIDI